MSKEILNKVKGTLYEFCMDFIGLLYADFQDRRSILVTTTDIRINEGEILEIIIESHLPGLIIGEKGARLEKIKQILEFKLKREVKIKLLESKIWRQDD